jgi:hypothetical protein
MSSNIEFINGEYPVTSQFSMELPMELPMGLPMGRP